MESVTKQSLLVKVNSGVTVTRFSAHSDLIGSFKQKQSMSIFLQCVNVMTMIEVQETTHGLGTGTEIEGKFSSKRKLFEIEVDRVC
jgi:hypothetical protein